MNQVRYTLAVWRRRTPSRQHVRSPGPPGRPRHPRCRCPLEYYDDHVVRPVRAASRELRGPLRRLRHEDRSCHVPHGLLRRRLPRVHRLGRTLAGRRQPQAGQPAGAAAAPHPPRVGRHPRPAGGHRPGRLQADRLLDPAGPDHLRGPRGPRVQVVLTGFQTHLRSVWRERSPKL